MAETNDSGTVHTPGPWFARHNGHYWDIRCEDGLYGQAVGDACASKTMYAPFDDAEGNPTDNGEANARLMAAAPDLLEALRSIAGGGYAQAKDAALLQGEAVDIARAAIAKAEGRP